MNHLEYLFGLEQFGIKFGLDNIRAILARLDHPERAYPAVHIAGTNGKGSVTAMVETGLRAAGYRTGRYTSPHLIELRERFAVCGIPVAQDAMIDAIGDVRAAVEALQRDGSLDVHPTFFEVTTAVAFELFRRAHIEIAVVEVGLGGRLDATNVLTPVVTAITSIAFDHQLYLGMTLSDIAREKAGIIKPGVPVILGDMDPSARAAIEEVAGAQRAPVVHAEVAGINVQTLALRGRHQRVNAAIAVGVLDALNARGISVLPPAVDAALTKTQWSGRIDRRSVSAGRELLMDAAHNPAGAQALASFLQDERMRPPLVFAAMRDKDVDGMFRALLPTVHSVTFTRATNPRSADPAGLAAAARAVAPSLPVAIEPVPADALARAWKDAPLILVAGSVFLLGDVMQHLGLH